jgi:hypothetical protein
MNQTIYKVVKLTNGEDLICKLSDAVVDGKYEIAYPLKIQVISQLTPAGPVESLNLSMWMAPYTEKICFNIEPQHILLIAEASIGLSKYYEHVIHKINTSPDENNLDDINNEDVYDDLLNDIEVPNKSIH